MSYIREHELNEKYKEVALAVIARAALDYMEYKQELYHLEGIASELVDRQRNELESEIKKLERFFEKSIYMQYAEVSADWVITTLNKEFEKWKTEQDKLLVG